MARTNQRFISNEELQPTHSIGSDNYSYHKDFQTHHDVKFPEMDKIVEEYHRLQKLIDNDQNNSLLEQIDQWEKNTVSKIYQVAVQARQDAMELLSSRKVKINNELKNFSQELAQLRASENYAEQDLKRLKQMIAQLEEDFKRSNRTTNRLLHTERSDNIDWKGLIYVGEKQLFNSASQQETVTSTSMTTIY